MDESLVLFKTDNGFIYNRASLLAKEYSELINKLNGRYNAKTLLASSGMNSINIVLNTILNNHKIDNLIYGNELYCDTPRLFKYLKPVYKYNSCEIDVTDTNYTMELFKTKFRMQTNVLFVEACSNPSGFIFDMSIVKKLRDMSKKLFVIVDNTWLSSVIYNPLDHGADVVISSLTKYYSGGTHIGGAVMTRDDKIYNKIYEYIRFTGVHISPLQCKTISENIDTIDQRIKKSSKLTTEIAVRLSEHENVLDVSHPSLINHPSSCLAKNLFNGIYPSVLTFKIKQSEKKARELMNACGIEYKTSFGSKLSRLDPWPVIVDDTFIVCRLAIGYDDNCDSIIKKLSVLLGGEF
ncbi:MAG: Cys/Met metabolism, pyridoxal phosphate-dependent enzyme [Edafosvirus sp.]|uniref:Cys/Met metabolism, pyridoxal phosphate-dependent enzyme n=1 Tax=Edafosvirus sp. TaxID=2487765 RepID=A0A3G4ZT98_9VIRU|nr:MAG: Cys/Met metabolism, pyridoxal phosphate-dependent enzyme [Edafosvirus sp.]